MAALRLILLEHKARTGRRDDELVFGSTAGNAFTPTAVRRRALNAWRAENERRTEAHEKVKVNAIRFCSHRSGC